MAFREDTRFSKGAALKPITFPMMGPNIQGYDGREHTVHRSLVSPAFRRTMIPRYVEPLLKPLAEELLFGRLSKGGVVRVTRKSDEDKLSFSYEERPPEPAQKEPELVE